MRFSVPAAAFAGSLALAAAPAQAATPGSDSQAGVYLGVHVGYGAGSKDWQGTPNPIPVPPLTSANLADHSANGLLFGGTIGARLEAGGLVLGLEGELSWADMEDSSPSTSLGGLTNSTDIAWTGSLTAQVGINAGSLYPYVEAGIGFVRDRYSVVDANAVAPDQSGRVTDTRTGVVLGAGAEFALGGGWAARAEYNYGNFGRRDYVIGGTAWTIDQTTHSVRLGFLYRFGS